MSTDKKLTSPRPCNLYRDVQLNSKAVIGKGRRKGGRQEGKEKEKGRRTERERDIEYLFNHHPLKVT